MEPERLIAVVTVWAAERDEILAAALCGSRATGTSRPDSDIDLVLVCTNRERLLADISWARDFGSVRIRKSIIADGKPSYDLEYQPP